MSSFLTEAYVYGPLVDLADELQVIPMAFVVDLPPDRAPWWSEPAACLFLIDLARLDRLSVTTWWRPAVWPIWNHEIVRPVRIWSQAGGIDTDVLDALTARDATRLRPIEPTPEDYAEQLRRELDLSLAHLRRLQAGYYEDPRDTAAYDGFSGKRSHHLWRAVTGYLDVLDGARAAGVV